MIQQHYIPTWHPFFNCKKIIIWLHKQLECKSCDCHPQLNYSIVEVHMVFPCDQLMKGGWQGDRWKNWQHLLRITVFRDFTYSGNLFSALLLSVMQEFCSSLSVWSPWPQRHMRLQFMSCQTLSFSASCLCPDICVVRVRNKETGSFSVLNSDFSFSETWEWLI